jgi:nickel-dependent lactate racemase
LCTLCTHCSTPESTLYCEDVKATISDTGVNHRCRILRGQARAVQSSQCDPTALLMNWEVALDQHSLPYGRGNQAVVLSQEAMWVQEQESPSSPVTKEALVKRALASPTGLPPLSQLVDPGKKVAIVVSDITRPCPTVRLLPPLLSELQAGGMAREDIRVVFALGSHRCLTTEEQTKLVGEQVFDQVCCGGLGTGPFVELGRTGRGTPVQVFQPVVEADWRVYVGNIEYHYFAGYTGGAKALMPGVCSQESIRANHSWMVQDSAAAGRIRGNPVREDIEEAAALAGPAFLLNVVLDGERHIVEAVAGDVTLAHRRGCRKVDELYRVPLAQRADIVLASAGGWPKDINFYQAHKALENAALAVRDGGVIILIAECSEGIGHARFAEWLTCGDPPEELLRRIKENFVLGGHKAASIAKTTRRGVRIFLVSALEPQTVEAMSFAPFSSAQDALAAAYDQLGSDAALAVMPHAGSTLPELVPS